MSDDNKQDGSVFQGTEGTTNGNAQPNYQTDEGAQGKTLKKLDSYNNRNVNIVYSQAKLSKMNSNVSSAASLARSDSLVDSTKTVGAEAWKLVKMAVPAGIQQSIAYVSKIFTLIIIGHYTGPNEMAAASLGLTFINVTGTALFLGLAGALDTYCNQSYTGNRKMTGIYLQKCLIITAILSIPIVLAWSQCGKVFLLLAMDPEVCRLCQLYVNYSIIGIIPTVLYTDIAKFLQAQGIFTPVFLIQLATLPLYYIVQLHLVTSAGLGFVGAPLGLAICDWILAILFILYATFVDGYQAWSGFSKQALVGLGEYFWFSFNSMLQICSEWWAFEITNIESGWINVDSLAAQSIISTLSSTCFYVFLGISVAASVQIGNYMGSNMPKEAKLAARLSTSMSIGVGATIAITIYFCRNYVGIIFTNYKPVIHIINITVPLLACQATFDALQCTAGGVLRGLGRQEVGAYINLFAYYCLAIPLGYFFTFNLKFGLPGIWMGILCGISTQAVALMVYIQVIDWDKAAADAKTRVNAGEGDPNEPLITSTNAEQPNV